MGALAKGIGIAFVVFVLLFIIIDFVNRKKE